MNFGGRQLDQAVEEQIVQAIQPDALRAAVDAAGQRAQQQQQRRQLLERELEQLRYEVTLSGGR